jgi:2-polyprenyl-6-methoxyphenol hydroxylase-like FAD-dependent oxidoreductase
MPLSPSSKVAIVGGGISGIIAALELENRGFSPVIFDFIFHETFIFF